MIFYVLGPFHFSHEIQDIIYVEYINIFGVSELTLKHVGERNEG